MSSPNTLFFSQLAAAISTSSALALVCSDDPLTHVVYRRYRRGGEYKGHTQLLKTGPVLYLWPGSQLLHSVTAQDRKGECTINCTVCQRGPGNNDSVSDTVTVVEILDLADNLAREILQKADGTGGKSSILSPVGYNLTAVIETPVSDGNASTSETHQNISFRAYIT